MSPSIYHQTNAYNAHITAVFAPTPLTASQVHAQRTTLITPPPDNAYQMELKESS
jgi:hypothetical protein